MGSWKKWLINAAILGIIFSLITYYVFHEQDPRILFRLLDMANGWYWIAGIILVFIYISCESLILRLLFRNVGVTPPRGRCLVYSFIGFFFSAITPAAGGGQPAQVYYMHKDGLNPGITSPILVVVTVGFKIVLVVYGLIALLVQPTEILQANDIALLWAEIGFATNIVIISMLMLAIFKPIFLEKVIHIAKKIIGRFINPKRLDRLEERIERSIDNYRKSTDCIKNKPSLMAMVFVISFVQRSILFSITWLVLLSFGITKYSLLTIIIMQSMVALGTDLLPLPGGSGAYEAMFLLLFEGICGEQLVLPVMVASRGISFYGQLIICGIVAFIGVHWIIGRERKNRSR